MQKLLPYLFLAPWIVAACDGGAPFEVAEPGSTDDAGSDLSDAASDADDGDAEVPNPCPPPADPKKAALCLKFEPEAIDFVADDERFDGKGVLHVAIFDLARPAPTDAPLDDKTVPSQAATPVTKPLPELVAEPLRFELAPGTVYARAVFLDDLAAFGATKLKPGVWLGGFDLATKGLREDAPLVPIEIEAGKGWLVEVELRALRRMAITVARGKATPVGDGEGPLLVLALDAQKLDNESRAFGVAAEDCADLSKMKPVTVEGAVVGKGPYWLTAVLNDFGQEGSWPGGALVSFDWQNMQIAKENELTYEPTAYSIEKTIAMTAVMPMMGGLDDEVSCND